MTIICAILFGMFRGYKEGMVMIQPQDPNASYYVTAWEIGVRSHKWFKYYHTLSCLIFLSFFFLVFFMLDIPFSILYLIGIIFLQWELFELFYSFSRYGKFIENEHPERILAFDAVIATLSRKAEWVFHGLRMAAAVILLIIG